MNDSLRDQYASTPLFGGNAPFVEALYESFLLDPSSVSPEWREYFARLQAGAAGETPHGPILAELKTRARTSRPLVADTGLLRPDLIGVLVYAAAALLWLWFWRRLIAPPTLPRVKLLAISFWGALLVFAANIGLACFSVQSSYESELSRYAYVENNATAIAGFALAIAIFVNTEFRRRDVLIRSGHSERFLKLLLWAFLLSAIGCLPLYWIPPRPGWLTLLMHLKTVPFTYAVFTLASAIIIFIDGLASATDGDDEHE